MFERPPLVFPFDDAELPFAGFAGDLRSECAKWQSTREQLIPYLHGLIGVLLAGAVVESLLDVVVFPFGEFRFICLRKKFISFSFVRPQLIDRI